ncbi:MAG: PAS domain S-box protein, partial [Candidatus Neomarinimicrobiota bacterium]
MVGGNRPIFAGLISTVRKRDVFSMKNPLRNIAYLEPDPERKQYRSFFSQHAVLFPLLAFLLFLLITAGISRYLEKENEAKLKARLVLTANQTAHRLEDYLRIHFNVIRFLRDHIVNDPFPAPEDFAAEVEDIMGQFAGFQAINYVNAQGVIEQVVPYRPNLLALGKDLHTHPMAAPYFKKAEQTHLDVCTDQVRLYQGGKGFATYFPIIQNGRVSGYLNGVFRIEQFLGPLFLNHTTPNYYFFLQDAKGQLVLDNSDDHSLRYDPLAEIRKIPFLDHAWTLTVTPNPVLVSQTRTRGSLLVFFLGTAASVILSWLYRITLVRQRKLYATMDTIRKEEENYRELIDNSPFGMGVFRDGKFIYINDAGVRLVGAASAKQFLNTPLEDIVHVDDQKGLVDQVGELVRHPRKTQPLEVKLVRLDNQVIDVELDASQILFEGEPATLVVARDITDRKQAEQARKESETWYRTLFESATDAIFIMSRDRFIDCNQRTLEMFGCRREDIIEQPPWKFSPVIQYDQRPSKEAALEKINAAYAGIPQSFEWLHCKLDGTLFDAHVNLNRVVIAGDEYLLATVRDISMEKRVEKVSAVTYQIAEATVLTSDIDALYQMIHEKLSLILDTTNIYIALVDLDRKQVSFPYFVDQYDTPPESMPLKRGLTDYVLSLGRPLLVRQQELARLIREGTIVMEGTRPKVWLGAPLVTEKRKIGVIALQNYEDETVYTEADMEILNFVSDQIAIAIDRKRAETDRLRQQTYFQQLFNNSPQGIVILNKQDEILNINKGFEDLFQYTREELVGKKLAYHIV